MTANITIPTKRTNQAHAAMWAVGGIFFVGGAILAIAGFLMLQNGGGDSAVAMRASLFIPIGVYVSGVGALLTLIAWVIAAAKP